MLKRNYDPALAAGTICASGTLGQIIPPSIVLVLLGDVLSSAYQQAQLNMGVWSPETVSVGDLFVGALVPGLLLVVAYLAPHKAPAFPADENEAEGPKWLQVVRIFVPPLLLILAVLGSILAGLATPIEAASVGAVGALLLAYWKGALTLAVLRQVVRSTALVTSMVFMILIGASVFSLVFRGFGGGMS